MTDDPEREALNELARWGSGTAMTRDLARRLRWTPRSTLAVLRGAQRAGFVTARRSGGKTYGRPLWWTLTDAGRKAMR